MLKEDFPGLFFSFRKCKSFVEFGKQRLVGIIDMEKHFSIVLWRFKQKLRFDFIIAVVIKGNGLFF